MKNSLVDASTGENVVITGTSSSAKWLGNIGFIPGTKITLLTKSGCGVTVRVQGIKYAMCPKLARSIYINATSVKSQIIHF